MTTNEQEKEEYMSYSIKEVADMMGVTTSTLRYYDKEGLLPDVERKNGIRVFEDKDFKWLRVLNCLKNTNMPIKKIKEYVDLTQKGDSTLNERYQLIKEQKANILAQIEQLNYYLKEIEYKEWYYETAIERGTEKEVESVSSPKATLDIDQIPKK